MSVPQRVSYLGGRDGAVVVVGGPRCRAVGRAQAVLAHDTPHAPAGGAHALMAQAHVDLAVALAVEWRAGDGGADDLGQVTVAGGPDGPGPTPLGGRLLVTLGIDGGAGHAPDPADPRETVGMISGGRDGLTHFLDLRASKGLVDWFPRRRIFSSSSSFSIVISPSFWFKRAISSSR